ncbi:phosphotransferase [Tenggerimyces flavus]|uniref:Phosphotransferase family protein n=1 Tax=Tenggerimyces flavus TaxID=1708749 RepID=A0ABV7Y646_9ACTN|nr:phosphotransferase [Tenggerimyces flavus]MBM7791244.1 putative membrane protein [Tenggerimyces flavus]
MFSGTTLTKRYVSWSRGEHLREWAVLRHLALHSPGLAPLPLSASLETVPPEVVMAVIPGSPVPPSQLDALASALTRLWAVPIAGLPAVCAWVDDLRFGRMLVDGPRPSCGVTASAYDAAVEWWTGPDPALLRTRPDALVLGHRDPNLANYLWDGSRVRIVDFEDATISDPATELAIFAEHLATREVPLEEFAARFDVDSSRYLAARRLWAMFWLRLLLPGGPAEPRNPPGTADRQAERVLTLLQRL